MGTALWISFLFLTAVGASLTALFLWQKWFAKLVDEHASLVKSHRALEAERAWFEEGRRFVRKRPQQAFLCLGETRIEQRRSFRHYAGVRYLVIHERVIFRNIALSNWLEQEAVLEPSDNVDELAQAVSLFASSILGSPVEPVKPYVDELQPPPFALETVSAPERVAQT